MDKYDSLMAQLTEEKKDALAHVEAALIFKQAATTTFEQSIIKARAVGCTLREIEKVAGMSNVSVLNLTRRVKTRQ